MDILLIAIFAFVLHVTPETTDCFRIIAPDGQEYRAVQEPDRWFRLEQLPLMPNREAQRVILRDGELIIQTNGVENHHTPILTDKEAKIQGTFPQMSMEQEGGIWRIDWRKRLVCFGDSLTSCGGNGGRYSDILSELLPEYEVINRGIGGDTIGGGLVRFDRDVLALNPDLLIFELGANDYWRRERTLIDLETDMEKMFQRAHKAGIKILIAGCFGNEDCDRPIDFNKAGLPLDDYAAGIAQIERRLAKRYGARRLPDLQETIRPNTRKEFWSDSNHPNAAGNREVANLLIPLINEISDDK